MAVQLSEKAIVLLKFADTELATSAVYTRQGDILADKIFNTLKANTSYIDRVFISGSMGKRSGLGDAETPDYDLVLFCNGKQPPFNNVVQEFVRILRSNLSGVSIMRCEPNEHMVQIKYEGYDFDVCPAQNLVPYSERPWSTPAERQRDVIYGLIKNSGDPLGQASAFSTGLAETARNFLRAQSAFTHSVVRLAKYWNREIHTEHFPGRKLLIETVAVEAAQLPQSHPDGVYHALLLFLRKMLNFETINCVFEVNYKRADIPSSVLNSRPLVLDPANPWNNLAGNVSSSAQSAFKKRAQHTLDQLNHIGRRRLEGILSGP